MEYDLLSNFSCWWEFRPILIQWSKKRKPQTNLNLQFPKTRYYYICLFSSVQSISRVWLFVTPWTTACQASLSIASFQSLPKLMSIESVMPSNHLILCCLLLLLPSIFLSFRVFWNESALRIRWPKYWSFNLNISPFNEHPGLISFRMDWLESPGDSQESSPNTTVQKHQFFSAQLSL